MSPASGNKTGPTDVSVDDFIAAVPDDRRRADAVIVRDLMAAATGETPRMWGPSMVGFGEHHYVYDSGREGDTFVIGFSPRKSALTLYLTAYRPVPDELLARLGKHRLGKGCLYVNRLSDVDADVLAQIIRQAARPDDAG